MLSIAPGLISVALCWDGGEVQVDHWTARDGLPQNTVTDLVQTTDGYIWLTTFGGVARFDGVRFTVFSPANTPALPSSRFVSVAESADGALWFGSEDHGLVHLGVDGRFERREPYDPGVVWDLRTRPDGAVWAQTDAMGWVCVEEPCGNAPSASLTSGTRWGRTALGSWRDERWEVFADRLQSIDSPGQTVPIALPAQEGVRAVMEDREGGLWVGLNGGGLARLRATGVKRVSAESRTVSRGPGPSVVVWACRDTRVVAGGPVDLPDLSGFCGAGAWDDEGALWLLGGSQGSYGVGAYSGGAVRTVRVTAGSEVEAIVEGPWWSLEDGVYGVRDGEPVRVAAPGELGERSIRVVRASPRGGVWTVGSSGDLLRVGFGGLQERLPMADTNAAVRDVHERDGGVWVSTYGGGLRRVTGAGESASITLAQGLCDDSVSRVLAVGDFLWVHTNRGAGRVPLAELDAVAAGRSQTVTCELLDSGEADGAGGVLGFDGRLYLPTIHGAVSFDPKGALQTAPRPLVAVEQALYGEQAVGTGSAFTGPGDLSIRYTALSFDDPVGVRFRHRLRGHHDPWTPLSADRLVRFVDLPPGRYRFEVQARSARGAWSDVVGIGFIRRPLWYETAFARYLLPLLGFGLLLGMLLLEMRRVSRRNQVLRSEVKQRLHAENLLREKQMVEERAARDDARARRLEALGRLAGGVAHDFNNLLTVILGRMELLRDHPDREVAADAAVAGTAAERASELTAQLLAFGRRDEARPQVIDMAIVVEELRDLLIELLGSRIRLELALAPGIRVQMDRGRLEQAVTNLCVNARDAIEGNGLVEVRVSEEEAVHGGRAGRWAVLRVRDDGSGIAPEVAEQIFEPYFTTKPPGQGLGLGLATVHGVVEEAGGTLRLDSRVGEGTTFRILLPLVDDPPLQTHRVPGVETSIAGVRVLLVDDDEAVRRTVALQLGLRGAEVRATGAPLEAIEMAADGHFDLLITDVLMPAMSGRELADKVDLPVLYISGHTGDALGFDAASVVLRKPFTSEVLASQVLEILAVRR